MFAIIKAQTNHKELHMSDTTKKLIQLAIDRVENHGGIIMVGNIRISRDGNGIIIDEM